jgi:hypothetical protein
VTTKIENAGNISEFSRNASAAVPQNPVMKNAFEQRLDKGIRGRTEGRCTPGIGTF